MALGGVGDSVSAAHLLTRECAMGLLQWGRRAHLEPPQGSMCTETPLEGSPGNIPFQPREKQPEPEECSPEKTKGSE